jgi:MATE family multidrug resistance protein
VEKLAEKYISIRVWSAPAAISLYGIVGWLIALERTKSVLVLQLFMNGVNVLLDIWFVLGLNWGIEGVAVATAIAEVSALILGLFLCYDRFKDNSWPSFQAIFSTERLKNMLSINLDIFFRSIMLQAIFVSFLLYGGKFGDVKLAANQILLQFLHIAAHGLDGFAFAAETLVGQAFGRKDRTILRKSVKVTSKLAFLLCCIMAIIFFFIGSSLIDVMTTAEDVRSEAKGYIIFIVLVPILGASAYMLDGIFVGAMKTKDMRNMMFISLIFYFLALILLVPHFENIGLWLALFISFVVRGVTLALRYPSLEKSI